MNNDSLARLVSYGMLVVLVACAAQREPREARDPDILRAPDAARGLGPTSANPGALIGGQLAFPQALPATSGSSASAPSAIAASVPPRVGLDAIGQSSVEPGDPGIGRDFALGNCRPCHVVAADQASPIRFANAPDFHAIADATTTTTFGLTVWLTNPHPTMPTLVLSPAETANVIAYIRSLRRSNGGGGP